MNFDWTTGSLGATTGVSIPVTQGYSSSNNNSANSANASGMSTTEGREAREWSAKQAELAFERQKELMNMEMEYNAKQAQISRDWNESMANTVYTRSVNNMREAGINPILAANMGLSGASVGSGQTASISGSSAPMAQSFADSSSAWQSHSQGESHGSSSSESGIITALAKMGEAFGNALGAINSAMNLNINLGNLEQTLEDYADKPDSNKDGKVDITDSMPEKGESFGNWLLDELNPFNSPLLRDLTNRNKEAKKYG